MWNPCVYWDKGSEGTYNHPGALSRPVLYPPGYFGGAIGGVKEKRSRRQTYVIDSTWTSGIPCPFSILPSSDPQTYGRTLCPGLGSEGVRVRTLHCTCSLFETHFGDSEPHRPWLIIWFKVWEFERCLTLWCKERGLPRDTSVETGETYHPVWTSYLWF